MSFISARLKRLVRLGILAFFIPPGIASAASGPVAGHVTSGLTGTPLANVVVKILQTGDSTQTDGTGHYAFANVPNGYYTMLFGRSIYQPLIKTNVALGPCCLGTTGNVDCDPTNNVDIADLSALVDNLYVSLNPLCCPTAANIDGQPGIDISDLSALVDFLYVSFHAPAPCQ